MTMEETKDGNGNIVPAKIFKRFDPTEPEPASPLPGVSMRVDDSDVIDRKITAGVHRGDMRATASVSALYHNIGTQYLEYEATDPRWPRNSGTYGECTDVTSDIIKALLRGYPSY